MIEDLKLCAIELLSAMIEIPSLSRNEQQVADFFELFVQKLGFSTLRVQNNIIVKSPFWDESKPLVLLNSHIDTVSAKSDWTKDPFKSTLENGALFGLGANDAGASVVSLLMAFSVLSKKEQPYNLVFVASAEEEVSGANGIIAALQVLPPVALAVVGEPTGMNLAIAEKGLMVLDCTVYGKSGHAARNEGDNAIYKALKEIAWFSSYQFPNVSKQLGEVKMSVTIINAGTQHNVVPDKCTFTVDVRTNEYYKNSDALDIIKNNVNCEVIPRSTRLNSSRISENHPIVKRGLLLGLTVFGSPTTSDQSLMNFTSIKVGPGNSARSHTADEFILLDEIGDAIDKYIKLLDNLEIEN